MTNSGIRAWRFVHPGLLAGTDGRIDDPWRAGLQFKAGGGVELAEDDEAVRQAILLLLSTRPGERLMRPEYGCHLHQLVFAPNNETTAGVAIYFVRRALLQWEPRIDIVRLDAARDPECPSQLVITLEYQVRTTGSRERLEVVQDLGEP